MKNILPIIILIGININIFCDEWNDLADEEYAKYTLFEKRKEFDLGYSTLQNAIKNEEKSTSIRKDYLANYYYMSGVSLFYLKNYFRSITDLEKSIAIMKELNVNTDHQEYWVAKSLSKINKISDSIKLLSDIEQRDKVAYYVRINVGILYGEIYEEMNDFEKSELYYKNTIILVEQEKVARNFSKADCLRNLGRLYFKQNNFSLAIEYYNKATFYNGIENNQQILEGLSKIYYAQNNIIKSIEILQEKISYELNNYKFTDAIKTIDLIEEILISINKRELILNYYEYLENYFKKENY